MLLHHLLLVLLLLEASNRRWPLSCFCVLHGYSLVVILRWPRVLIQTPSTRGLLFGRIRSDLNSSAGNDAAISLQRLSTPIGARTQSVCHSYSNKENVFLKLAKKAQGEHRKWNSAKEVRAEFRSKRRGGGLQCNSPGSRCGILLNSSKACAVSCSSRTDVS